MSQTINVNGESINYPETGDTNWGDEATQFAIQTSAALGKIGLSSGTTVDVASTLDVTGATTLDSTLTVAGTTTLNGTANLNGNTNLGNAITDTIAVTGIVNVDSGTLYVDPTNNRVGINKTNPVQALDVVGNAAISGNETVGGTLGVTGATTLSNTLVVTGDISVNTNKFNITASSGNTTIAGTLGVSNGTASAPSITPSGDTNTGLYSIGSDKIGFAANGSRVGEFGSGYGGFTGNIIQVAYSEITTSGVSGSVTIPIDNTIPQNTEGAEILTCSITPLYANSILYVESNCFIGENSNVFDSITAALFRDSTADAISVSINNASPTGAYGGAIAFNPIYLLAKVSASSTSSTTFKLRAGGSSAGVIRWNGANGSQYFNGKLITYIRIIEVQV